VTFNQELEWIAEGGSQVTLAPTAAAKGTHTLGRRGVILSLGTLLVAVVTGLAVWNLKPSPSPPAQSVSRFTITLPPGQRLAGLEIGTAVAVNPFFFSPDGQWLGSSRAES
jgi:hypothetical protein